MNYFIFLKEQQDRKKLREQTRVQEKVEISFMSAWFALGVFSFINYLFDAILKEVNE